jgi:hypothetical protein
MIGAFKDNLPHGRGIVNRSGREKQPKIVGGWGRQSAGASCPRITPTDTDNALDVNRAFACNISANFRIEFQNDSLVAAEKY